MQWIRGAPIQIWSVHQGDGIGRTIYICEGWNLSWKSQLEKNNRNMWGILTALKIQERNQKRISATTKIHGFQFENSKIERRP